MSSAIGLLLVACQLLFSASVFSAENPTKHPVYLSFLIHCEASPIRGVPVDVQTEPYSGEGVLPRNRYLDRILNVCGKYGIKFEFAVTPIFAQQLREDRPDIIERIKRMQLPISRYPSLAGHVLPGPVAGILLWGMAQLYRYVRVLGVADDVYLRSCRLIKDQLHYLVVGFNPISFSRQTYRYRR